MFWDMNSGMEKVVLPYKNACNKLLSDPNSPWLKYKWSLPL